MVTQSFKRVHNAILRFAMAFIALVSVGLSSYGFNPAEYAHVVYYDAGPADDPNYDHLNIYTWTDSHRFSGLWPGDVMEKVEIDGNLYFAYGFKDEAPKYLIFSYWSYNADRRIQTADLSYNDGVYSRGFYSNNEHREFSKTAIDGVVYTNYISCAVATGNSWDLGSDVIILETVQFEDKDFPVIGIAAKAFENKGGLKTVSMPTSVECIGRKAFSGCKDLISVAIPPYVNKIGYNAFDGCESLAKTAYPSSISNPVTSGAVIQYPADDCLYEDGFVWNADKSYLYYAPITISELTLSASLQFASAAFNGCDNLTSLTLESSIPYALEDDNSFGKNTFANCMLNVPDGSIEDYLTKSVWARFDNMRDGNGEVKTLDNGNFKYRINPDNGLAYLAGPVSDMSEATILAKVRLDGSMYDVTAICSEAFMNKRLSSVTFRDGIKNIGYCAFQGNRFSEIVVPESVTLIGAGAFIDNGNLRNVTLPDNLDCIETMVFMNTGLREVTIPANVKSIGYGAFYGCSRLDRVEISKSVKEIGNLAFARTGLTEVDVPGNVEEIGEHAFGLTTSLKSVKLGEGVKKIGKMAFTYLYLNETNEDFQPITIPGSVIEIGDSAFFNQGAVGSIELLAGVEPLKLGKDIFCGVSLSDLTLDRNLDPESLSSYTSLCSPSNVVIGNTVTEIPGNNFFGKGVRNIVFGSSIAEIPTKAFYDCYLKKVVIPANVNTIGESAFQSNQLEEVVNGSGLTYIGEKAFAGNNGVKLLQVTAPEPPVATDDVFSTQNCLLRVLPQSKDAYANADCWYQFEQGDLKEPENIVISVNGQPMQKAMAVSGSGIEAMRLTATVEPADASLAEYIFWSSSNPEVATVDTNGVVTFTGTAEGTAEITVKTLYADVLASVKVTADGNIDSGINDILNDEADNAVRPNDIYTLQGVCLKKNASEADINALSPGIYIVAGKKVYVK